jgi:methionyl-tRNA synthetase
MKQSKILVTSALPYANGPIHFGHLAGAYLPADCYVRFQRLKKRDVLYICGSDEYGVAIAMSAELAKRSPKEHVDIFHDLNKKLFQQLNISFDHYSRTTASGHKETSYEYFQDLLQNGFIEEKESEQLYSEQDHKFLADRYVVGTCPRCGFQEARGDECTRCGASYEAEDLKNPRSKLTNAPLSLKKTTHWYLRLDLFKEKLLSWLDTKAWKSNVVHFVKGYIQDLRPRAITRDMSWGIPVPLEKAKGKVLYVWFDAPIGYISATKEWAEVHGNKDAWKDYWLDSNTKLIQFIGKDNIPFHAVIFPAMTMGQNKSYKLVDELPANEFYNLEGKQFSKSEGWYIDLEDFLTRYDADMIRYTIAANAPETSDSEFTWKDFQTRCNSELLGKFGNFVNRTLTFIKNNALDGKLALSTLDEKDRAFQASMKQLVDEIAQSYDTFKLRRASQLVMELAQLANVYFDQKRPWQQIKDKDPALIPTLTLCLEAVKFLALTACPILPKTSQKIWQMLGQTTDLASMSWDDVVKLSATQLHVQTPALLFRRIEDEEIQKEIEKLNANQKKVSMNTETKGEASPATSSKPQVTIDDVRKLDLRIAKVVRAERVPKSKKLLRLEVDAGDGVRQIVAGIGAKYEPELLIGKHITIVANLAPAMLMGVESQGMLLAASSGEMLQVLEMPTMPPGSSVG